MKLIVVNPVYWALFFFRFQTTQTDIKTFDNIVLLGAIDFKLIMSMFNMKLDTTDCKGFRCACTYLRYPDMLSRLHRGISVNPNFNFLVHIPYWHRKLKRRGKYYILLQKTQTVCSPTPVTWLLAEPIKTSFMGLRGCFQRPLIYLRRVILQDRNIKLKI